MTKQDVPPEARGEFEGTKPVDQRLQFNARALEGFLAQRVEGLTGPLQIEQFKGGQSNPTYRITDASGQRFVLRRKPPGKLLPSAHAIEREFVVMGALHGAGFPVPKMQVLCEDGSVIGTPFFVMDYIDGRVLWDQSLPGMSRSERTAIWYEMNRVIAVLHSFDHKSLGLDGFGKPDKYIERQIARWSNQYRASETEKIPAMDSLIAWLPENIPPTSGASVVHGDFRLDNLVFDQNEPRILAVLDWELSTLGDPLADFAYHCLSWHVAPGHFRGIAGLDIDALGIPREADYVARYCARTGRAGIEPEHWDFYIAYNLFRIAAILQGIKKRVADGTAVSAQAREAGERAKPLAELGWIKVTRMTGRTS